MIGKDLSERDLSVVLPPHTLRNLEENQSNEGQFGVSKSVLGTHDLPDVQWNVSLSIR